MDHQAYVIGFDVGGTRLKSGAVLRDGTLAESSVTSSGFAMEPDEFMATVLSDVRRIVRALGRPAGCIALGFPGAVDPGKGIVLLPGKLKLEGYPVVPLLHEALGVPVTADNDGRLSILAEARYGKAQLHRWAVSITLGTGVGSGVMLDGNILRDPHLQFGTQASHIVQRAASDRLCITSGRGTPNILCSATALAIAVRDGLIRGLPSVLHDGYHKDPHSIDFAAVIRGVEQDDALCKDALARWTTNLSWFLVSVIHMYAPEIVILGGGAAAAASHFLPQVRAHVARHAFRYPAGESVPIVPSELTDFAGVYGAAALAWEQLESRRAAG